jgi:hypothetical protein
VEGGVTVDVGEMVQGLHTQQVSGRGRFSKHAGRHQRSQTFEVGRVHCHSSLNTCNFLENGTLIKNYILSKATSEISNFSEILQLKKGN